MQGGEQILCIPLQFWFCRNIGLSLPLVAIQRHHIDIRFKVRHFEQCWASSDGTFRQETPRILDAFLYVDHIFLDDDERRIFVANKHTYLIEQLQVFTMGMAPDVVDYQIDLDFNHPTKAMFWVIKHDTTCQTGIPESGNEFFNFSDRTVGTPGVPEDPMLQAKLQIEGNDLMKARINKYYREWVPYEYFARTPRNFIYCYSFAIDPIDWKPSGTVDLSRIDTFTLNLQVKDNLPAAQINVYAINYNVLLVEGGMAGVLYRN